MWVTGNTVIDAISMAGRPDQSHPELKCSSDSRIILVTAHRRENPGEPMRNTFRVIWCALNEHRDVKAIYPIHMNLQFRGIADIPGKGLQEDKLVNIERIQHTESYSVFNQTIQLG